MSSLLIEDSNRNSPSFSPLYYLGQWVPVYLLGKEVVIEDPCEGVGDSRYFKGIESIQYFKCLDSLKLPDFVLFCGNKNLEERVSYVKQMFPRLQPETEVEPGFIDQVMFKLNPINNNQSIYIYKTNIHSK